MPNPDQTDSLETAEERQNHFAAIAILRAFLSEEDSPEYRFKLATHLNRVGQVSEAETLFRGLIEADYEPAMARLNLGHTLKALGRSAEAADCYKWLTTRDDDQHASVGYWSLADLKDYRFSDQEITTLAQRSSNPDSVPGYRGLMLFALASALDRSGDAEAAFKALKEANDILAVHRPFRGDLYAQLIQGLCSQVSSVTANPLPAEVTPIFIVGMPRSGTTLIEQILASHSAVEATDELPYLDRLAMSLEASGGYAANLSSLSEQQIGELAQTYLSEVEPYRVNGLPFVIDKNPGNFMHVGLIQSLFPTAKIINLVRDPLDNALSVYKQYFNRGNNFSYTMEGIIYYWQGYLTILRHWEQVFPGKVLHISYEKLAAQPDEQIKRVLEYCGLPEEEACYRFYESDRPVLTPSVSQVRAPISTRSVGSGLKYQQFFKPLVPQLAQLARTAKEVLPL